MNVYQLLGQVEDYVGDAEAAEGGHDVSRYDLRVFAHAEADSVVLRDEDGEFIARVPVSE